jgi:hypothetical protein
LGIKPRGDNVGNYVLQGVQKNVFFSLDTIILQSMWLTF